MSANSADLDAMVAATVNPSHTMGEPREIAVTQDQSAEDQRGGEDELQETDGTTDSQESGDSGPSEHQSADNLKQKHNKKEKIRRQGLKDSIHALRNQLRIHKTKRATTVSVLKAARIEIHDLKSNEWKQKETLGKLKSYNEDLLQQIKHLRDGWSIPRDNRPTDDLSPSRPPPLVKLPPNSIPSPVPTSTIPPYHPPPPTLPFSYLSTLPYLPMTTGYHTLPLTLLTNTPTHHHLPLYSCGRPWFPSLGYTGVTLPHSRLGPTPLYPLVYTCVGAGCGHELLTLSPHIGKERDERSPPPEDDEEAMVDVEGDGTDEQGYQKMDLDSCNKESNIRSKLEAAAQASGVAGETQQPSGRLPSSPSAPTPSHADADIVLLANISDQFQPVREQLLHRSTAYTLDRLSKTFPEDNQDLDRDNRTKHIAMSENSHCIFMGQTQFPTTFSYLL